MKNGRNEQKKFFALNNKAGYGAVHLQADEQKEMTRGYVKSTHEHSKNKYLRTWIKDFGHVESKHHLQRNNPSS